MTDNQRSSKTNIFGLSEILTKDFAQYGLLYHKKDLMNCLFGKSVALKFLCLFRMTRSMSNKFLRKLFRQFLMRIERKYGLEIPDTLEIGEGLYIGHPYGITVNPEVKMGNKISLHKGVTIGKEYRGKRRGAPVIGNNVWFGINSTVVGGVKIGNDVLIAPNAFVNIDIPDHSVVIGNPCQYHIVENATRIYIR